MGAIEKGWIALSFEAARFLAALLLFCQSGWAFSLPAQVILLRHAEKPYPEEGSHLSEEGWAPARALSD